MAIMYAAVQGIASNGRNKPNNSSNEPLNGAVISSY